MRSGGTTAIIKSGVTVGGSGSSCWLAGLSSITIYDCGLGGVCFITVGNVLSGCCMVSVTAFTMTEMLSNVTLAPLACLAGGACLRVVDLGCLPLFPKLILYFTGVFILCFMWHRR